ncbi:MAG: hypothetical protein H8D45_09665 [Bacteroidetes bacterium]|nr:hypothetical protein [Bacteroidota bacterium]
MSDQKQHLARLLEKLFVVRSDVYCQQKKSGRYKKVESPLTTNVLLDHINGAITIGSYPFHNGNQVKWFCFDLDINKDISVRLSKEKGLTSNDIFDLYKSTLMEQARLIVNRAEHYGITLFPEFSGSKGFHLWGFCDGYVEASKIRTVCHGIMREVDMLSPDLHVEIFPKQDSVDEGLGNFVKIPCGIHQKSGNKCVLIDDEFVIPSPSEFSVETQFSILFDVSIGDDLVSHYLVDSLQEEFEVDDLVESDVQSPLDFEEERFDQIEVTSDRVENIFANCQAFSGMVETAKLEKYLTHGQRLVLGFSLVNLGKAGTEKLHEIIGYCDDYNKEEMDFHITNIRKKGYKPYTCEKLFEIHPHNNDRPICSQGELCDNVKKMGGHSPQSFSRLPRSKSAFRVRQRTEALKKQKEEEKPIDRIVSESNLLLAWQRVKNSLENEVWYDREEVERFESFLGLNIALLSEKLKKLKGKAIQFSPYQLIKVRKDNGDYRPIAVMDIEDHIITQAIMNVVAPVFDNETNFYKHNYGHRINDDYDKSLRNLKYWENQWGQYSLKIAESISHYIFNGFIKIDLLKYYEKIPHDKLKALFADDKYGIGTDVQIWLNSFIELYRFDNDEGEDGKGIPQGPEFSHILANIYLNQFDLWLQSKYGEDIIVHYRYVDDIYILLNDVFKGDSHKLKKVYNEISNYLSDELGLDVNPGKKHHGWNFYEGDDLLADLNRVKYRIGKEIKALTTHKGPLEGDEVEQIGRLLKGLIEFESDAEIDEILPHLNFASKSMLKLGIDTTSIRKLLIEKLPKWNPSTYNTKFLLKLLLDMQAEKPEDDDDITLFFRKSIDSYRRLLTQEVIWDTLEYGGYDDRPELRKKIVNLLYEYVKDDHQLVRGSSYLLLEKFGEVLDDGEWRSTISNKSVHDFEKRSLIRHLLHYDSPQFLPLFNLYLDNTQNGIPAGYSILGSLPQERYTNASAVLRMSPCEIDRLEDNPELIWETPGAISMIVFFAYTHFRFVGHARTASGKGHYYASLNRVFQFVPEQFTKILATRLAAFIPGLVNERIWNGSYFFSLFDSGRRLYFPTLLRQHVEEMLYYIPSEVTEKSSVLDKRRLRLAKETSDSMHIDLLSKVKKGELQENGYYPCFNQLKDIIEQEGRQVFRYDDTQSKNVYIYERIPIENIYHNSELRDEESVQSYLESLQSSEHIPIKLFEITNSLGLTHVAILYEVNSGHIPLSSLSQVCDEKTIIDILSGIEQTFKSFFSVRAEGQINLPHVDPYSTFIDPQTGECMVVNVGSAFDRDVHYFSIESIDLHKNSFSSSAAYFNLGFLSFELLTGRSAPAAWRRAKVERDSGGENKYLSHNEALEDTSYSYRWWILKDLCNIVPEFRQEYLPERELPINRIRKKYDRIRRIIDQLYEINPMIVHQIDKDVIEYVAFLDLEVGRIADRYGVWSKPPNKVLMEFLESYLDFLSRTKITWLKTVDGSLCDEKTLNYASRYFIEFAEELINFLSHVHDLYGWQLHDNWFYPALLIHQSVKNEVYCLLIALLDEAGKRSPDSLIDREAFNEIVQFQNNGDTIEVEFTEEVPLPIQRQFDAKGLLRAIRGLLSSKKDVFEKFHSESMRSFGDLLLFLNGKVTLRVGGYDEEFPLLKSPLDLTWSSLLSLIGNLHILNEKIYAVGKNPTEVSKDEFDTIIELARLIFAVTNQLSPASLVIGRSKGFLSVRDDKTSVEVDELPDPQEVVVGHVAFPLGSYEIIYEGNVGVALLERNGVKRISSVNPPPKAILKILEHVERKRSKLVTLSEALAVRESMKLQDLQAYLQKGDYFDKDVRIKMREMMGENKKIVQQKADQIINIDGEGHTINTGTVQQLIQPSEKYEKKTPVEENKTGITSGEFLLKSDGIDLQINNGEVIERVIERKYLRSKQEISRPYLFISAIADDNSKTNRRKIAGRTIRKRMEELDEAEERSITITNVSVYANVFRDQVEKALRKVGYELNRDSLLPDAKINKGYQLGDGFFITRVESE